MAKFFVGGGLPPVSDVRDVYAHAKALRERGVPILPAEADFLRQVTLCMLQIQHDEEEGELHQALARLSSLTLGIIEDDDFHIPEGYQVGTQTRLEGLAIQLVRDMEQLDLQIGAAMGIHGLDVRSSADVDRLAGALPASEELERVLRAARIHLRQGEGLLAAQADPERAARHRARLEQAYERTTRLLARLLALPPGQDVPVVRAHVVRRELRRIEVDALGTERLTEAEQERRTRELLAWAEEDLGERLTDADKAQLAERLREVGETAPEAEEDGEDAGWLFDSE